MTNAIHHPFDAAPAEGEAIAIAEGVLWFRLPLPMALDHVNCYALADADGWTLVDTGMKSRRSMAIWDALIAGPLRGKPVRRLIVTHHHPDHVGLAGWFQAKGVELIIPRTAWLYARMLTLDEQALPPHEALQFYRRAGASDEMLAQKSAERPFNFSDCVAPLPLGFTNLCQGDTIRLAGRDWRVELGQGHAPDHATLWSQSCNLVIGGDQLLPGISANIGVYPTEPAADPLGEWLDSTARFQPLANDQHLVLPGHKLPFQGLPHRLIQMAENHHSALARLRQHLEQPRKALECFVPLFKRELTGSDLGLGLVETVAHLNFLLKRGQVSRSLDARGAWIWQA